LVIRLADEALIKLAAGDNLVLAESLRRQLSAMNVELGGPSPQPLERLLVEWVMAYWLQVHYLDALISQKGEASAGHSEELWHRQDAAHKRHLAALKALATTRACRRAGGSMPVTWP
jgi:hypothetical protein